MPYGIQQPAISGQLSQLEKALGVRLFDRRPFGLRPAGAKLFNEIEPFFAGLGRLPAYVRGHAHEHLRLAAPGRILRDYLPVILAGYKHQYPDLELILHDVNQTSAEELLRRREIDIAITELESSPAGSFRTCDLVHRIVSDVRSRSAAACSSRSTPIQDSCDHGSVSKWPIY